MLIVENISKKFGGLLALNGVSFQVGKGEIVGIIGPNGSGKTTLFEIISGFSRPTSGKVLFNGARLDGLQPDQVLRRGLSRTFQLMENYQSLTAKEVLLLPLLSLSQKQNGKRGVEEWLEMLQYNSGLNTPLSHLSLPDRHIIEFIRAVITGPQMVLLDEVMSGLTAGQISALVHVIRQEQKKGASFLVIEHHVETVLDLCDRLIAFNLGNKIAEDIPGRIITNEEVISSYLGVKHDALSKKPG
jgi:branched-chain amino acid transport system ATP-binding protein